MGGDRQGVAGVVIQPGEDLGVGAIREPPVGDVGLPALVGQVGFEADVRGLRLLLRVRDHQSGGDEVATDRRDRHVETVAVLEVPADRHRPRVEPLGGELDAQVHDQPNDLGRCRRG